MADIEDMASLLKKHKSSIKKVSVLASARDILMICSDEATAKHIDIITSASLIIGGIKFELIKT